MDFVAIDFETANRNMTSACSLGIAIVKDNHISQIKEWYIRPTPFYFDYYNTKIHGITEKDVKDCPSFNELWSEIHPYLQDKTLVAHNAPFDMSILKHLINYYNLDAPCYEYFCSCELSRNLWCELYNHKLNTVCKHLDIKLKHHSAASDAAGSAQIVLTARDLIAKSGDSIESHIKFGNIKHIEYSDFIDSRQVVPFPANKRIVYSELSTSKCSFDNSHPFYDKDIVFTGDLLSLNRIDAIQRVLDLGARVKSGVSKNTDYLIVGVQDNSIVGNDGLSSKQKKAYTLIDKGIEIKILTENEFLKLIS